MKRRAAAAVICLAGAALFMTAHLHAHRRYFDRLQTDQTLYTPHAATTPDAILPNGLPRVRRLWIVILDGLRDDTAATLPTLQRLSAAGARRTLLSEFPTFTYPNLSTLVSGVPPRYSGVRLNRAFPRVQVDTLFAVGQRARVPVLLASSDGWPEVRDAIDPLHAPAPISVQALLDRPPAPEIAFVHFVAIDDAGHRHGAASRAYRDAALRGDALVAELANALDLQHDALIALSDHGHRDRGGHGGVEPEVERGFLLAVGRGVPQGVRLPAARMRDVASTVALLAGLPPPRDNLGAPMSDLLPDEVRAVGRQLARDDRGLGGTYRARIAAGRRWRLPLLGLAAVLVLGCGALLRRRCASTLRGRDIVPLGAYAGCFLTAYYALGYSFGWSMPRGEGGFIAETAIVGVAASVVAVLVGRLRIAGGLARAVEQAGVALAAMWLAYGAAFALSGTDPALMAGPRSSFVPVLVATAVFYPAGAFALRAGWSALRRSS